MYDLTLRAFNLSERYRVLALVMADEAIGHLRENMSINERVEVWNRKKKKKKGGSPFDTDEEDGVPPMPVFGEGERLAVTGSTHDAFGYRKTDDPDVHARLVSRINDKILGNREQIIETEDYFLEDSEIALIAYGFTARTSLYVVNHLRKKGMKMGMLRLKTLWPFPEEAVTRLGRRVKKVLVPEMNLGQVAGEVKKYCRCDVLPLNQTNGEVIRPETIVAALRKI
jgi:2-oxoglutarate ferredoxin oxidoreductase subunit alpha